MGDVFRFKQFDILQKDSTMKVNTDGVLLGAWCDIKDRRNVLDVGCGTGIIAIMLAQKSPTILSTGLEIDETACNEATFNMLHAPFNERLKAIHMSVQDFARSSSQKFDLIISNPPFYSGGTFSLNENKANVRHTIKLSHTDLLQAVKKLLDTHGVFDLILPHIEGWRFIELAAQYDLYPVRITEVYTREHKTVERLLIRLGLRYKGDAIKDSLIIQKPGTTNDYTDEFIALTREFYLNL
jgi:tRNA1Val (adenine37-N6)-methyltransferase